MEFTIELMNGDIAKEIMLWQYPEPYDIYSFTDNKETLSELMSGNYYYVKSLDQVIGFYCYGTCAQIPITEAESSYNDKNFLDIGLGVNPVMCGYGLGTIFIQSGIKFAIDSFSFRKFRLTVATFNSRAIKVYTDVGFVINHSFIRRKDNREFYIMVIS